MQLSFATHTLEDVYVFVFLCSSELKEISQFGTPNCSKQKNKNKKGKYASKKGHMIRRLFYDKYKTI